MTTKAELRADLKLKRLSLSPAQQRTLSDHIRSRLRSVVDWSKVTHLHTYEPLPIFSEANIRPWLGWLIQTYPKLSVYTSRLVDKKWQVIEFKTGRHSRRHRFDVVIVPMLGFDNKLHRIGFGGGYYDRLLAKTPKAVKIGICYESGRLKEVPTHAHDIALDLIVTDQTVYRASI